MSELQNFPIISQLDADANQYYDCVPTSIAAGLGFLLGRKFSGGELKDAVYGASYKGNTAAYEYVEYCLKQGVRLFPINGSPAYLVAQAHSELAKGHPVVFTEIDPYMPASSGETHVCVFFKDTATTLTEMDPFGGHVIEKTDAQWISTLQYNQIWSMEKTESITMGVPTNWKDDGTTLTAPNGVPVVLGFRQYVLANNWHPDNYPLQKEHATPQLEASNPALGGGTQQEFRMCVLEWNTKDGIFEMWAGQEIMTLRQKCLEVYAQNSVFQKQMNALQSQVNGLQSELKAAQSSHADAGEISSIIAALQKVEGQLSTLKG